MKRSASAAPRAGVITGAFLLFTAALLQAAPPGKNTTTPTGTINQESLNAIKSANTPNVPGANTLPSSTTAPLQKSLDAIRGQTGGAPGGGGGPLPPKKSTAEPAGGNNNAGDLFKKGDTQQNNRLLLDNDPASSAARKGQVPGAAGAAGVIAPPELGETAAGRKMDALRDKLGLEALDKLKGTEALPGALGTPGGDERGLPKSPRDPGTAGSVMNLPNPRDKAADGPVSAGAVRSMERRVGLGLRDNSFYETGGVWTGETDHGDPVIITPPGRDGVTHVSIQTPNAKNDRALDTWHYEVDRRGRRTTASVDFADGTTRTGEEVQEILRAQDEPRESAQGNTLGPSRASGQGGESSTRSGETRGGSRKGGDDSDSQHATTSSGSSSDASSGGTTSSSGKKDSGSGGTNSNSNGNSGKSDSGGADTAGAGSSSGNNDNSEKPDKPKDGKSQPVEGGTSNRDFFGEMGVTNPGDRPKQQGRGSDDRNIPDPSGVIIRHDGPRTPEEIKRMVTQPGVDGDARRGGGGGRLRDPWRFAQPPPDTGAGGVSPANPNPPGVTGSGTDTAPSIPNPSDPAERK
ncbi:MAG: hypothetical protein HZA91_17245 [Verrucomicrobia bacterium]|nr:hypothetical protein [Verrucomicrobiota bacterium]